ncbi:MAG: ATP-dependent Clp protease adapter ClpS [Panacagrimonas sp.]
MSDNSKIRPGSDQDLVVEAAKPKTKQPPMYKVVMVNDDFTPMEFVVQVLQKFFHHTRESAVQIMLHVHTKGRGTAGVYPAEIAETKTAQANAYARQHQHPLLTVLEKA